MSNKNHKITIPYSDYEKYLEVMEFYEALKNGDKSIEARTVNAWFDYGDTVYSFIDTEVINKELLKSLEYLKKENKRLIRTIEKPKQKKWWKT
jgi:hypothetical protein